ncbi:MAG: 4Fe-4S binding protein, partial [Deltaproteobacteria bacterium]|nr:4Fe-4S binding protein [Deltaproteobacteria bacterium]
LGLELLAPRFWCAHLCPLGALLGLAARLSPLRRGRAGECGACCACAEDCPTGAALGDPADPSLCLQCGTCEAACPREARLPGTSRPPAAVPRRMVRRALLASAGLGALAALAPRVRAEERERPFDFLRPPGAKPEEEFVRRCVRCGACMRVCPRGALHPSLFEAGLGGLWTPRLVPRLGYCEYHCRLCGQVCPTGAIGYLEEGKKEKTVIGTAIFDANRCLPYRKAQECMVCEEHCPTGPKAIVFREEVRFDPERGEKSVKVPRVFEKRCVGCGICETKCPLPGGAAIRVVREKPESLEQFY